jgi:long-chain acyl-CoA synthetase
MNVFDYFLADFKELEKGFVLGNKEQISYKKLYKNSITLSVYLKKNFGEENNILLISPNSVFFITAYLAIIKSGNVCIPINPDIETDNLNYIISQCRSKYAFISSSLYKKFDLEKLMLISEEDCSVILSSAEIIVEKDLFEESFNETRLAEIIFTSGSTGEPKGVMISHRNLIANTGSIIEYLKLTGEDIIEIVLPFYYCYGLSLLHTHLKVGGSVVLNNTFMFIGSVINDLHNYKCTGFAGVPSHFQILLRKTKTFKTTDFPYLKYVTQAGGKLHKVFIQEFINAFPGVKFYVMYGQTEATARLSYLPPEMLGKRLGSIGKGIPGVELDITNNNNEPVKPGEIGEIIARGNNIMMGYLNDPEGTKKTIRDGWLYTGDLAYKDNDGYFFLTARKKEIIKVGGKRISPKEIEEVIVSIPEVIDCTVEGTEDEILGEAIKAKIIISDLRNNTLTKEAIQKYCAGKLALFKVPQIIEFKDRIKVAATGKKVKNL